MTYLSENKRPTGYYNIDCMDALRQLKDKSIDLAIVDPPYFEGPNNRGYYGRKVNKSGVNRVYQQIESWKVPDKEYFDELKRVSKHQIVWGCNHYDVHLGPGTIVWDKCNGGSSFSDAELAYCSLHDSTRLFRFMWNGMMQGKSMTEGHIMQGNKSLNEVRIHPTQKPVILYKWLLQNYAKSGDVILDTHVGSASSLIACHDLGFKFLGFEKDEKMFIASSERLENHTNQLRFEDV